MILPLPLSPSNAEPQLLAKSYLSSSTHISVALQPDSHLCLNHPGANPLCQLTRGLYYHFFLDILSIHGTPLICWAWLSFLLWKSQPCPGNVGQHWLLLDTLFLRGLLALVRHFCIEDLKCQCWNSVQKLGDFLSPLYVNIIRTVSSYLHNFREIVLCFYVLSSPSTVCGAGPGYTLDQ